MNPSQAGQLSICHVYSLFPCVLSIHLSVLRVLSAVAFAVIMIGPGDFVVLLIWTLESLLRALESLLWIFESLLINLLWAVGCGYNSGFYWAGIITRIIVWATTCVFVVWAVRWLLSNVELDALRHEPPARPDRCKPHETVTAMRRAPRSPSPPPQLPKTVTLPDGFTPFPKFWWVDKSSPSERMKEEHDILQRQMARSGSWSTPKFKYPRRSFLRAIGGQIAGNTSPEHSALQEVDICDSGEPDIATGVVSSSAGPAEPLQCRDAAPAADAGRAHVPASTEEMVKQDVEPLRDVCAEDTRANPVLAPVQVSTDETVKQSDPRDGAPTWVPSSGVQYLPPRDIHPLFRFGWKPSSGPQYKLRQPHPLFAAPFRSFPYGPVPPVMFTVPKSQPAPAPFVPAVCTPSIRTSKQTKSPIRHERPSRSNLLAAERRKAALVTATPGFSPAAATVARTPIRPITITPTGAQPIPPAATATYTHQSVNITPTHATPAPSVTTAARAPAQPVRIIFPGGPSGPSVPSVPSAPLPSPLPTVSVARVSSMADQDWMKPIKEILALDIVQWGISEDELMAWKITPDALEVAQLEDEAAETAARKYQYTLATRYGAIAVQLKKALVILRIQLKHSRQGFQPDYATHDCIRKMMLIAYNAFKTLSRTDIGSDNFPGADFSAFRNAVGFYLDHIAGSKNFQDWVHEKCPEHGSDIIRLTKKRATFIRDFTGGNSSKLAALLSRP